jgi:hypothetical protein
MQNYVGILKQTGRDALLILDRPDQLVGRELFIPARNLHGAPFGMKAVARLTAEPGPDGLGAVGEITEVLGDPGKPDIAILGIIAITVYQRVFRLRFLLRLRSSALILTRMMSRQK